MRADSTRPAEAAAVPILRPTMLQRVPGLLAALSTRNGGVSPEQFGMNLSFSVGDDPEGVRENRRRFFGQLGIESERIAFQRQVHGTAIRVVDEPGIYPACDGLVARRPELFLAVSVADCVPVFLCDPVKRTVAVVHAGWRGAAAGVVDRALETLFDLGTNPSNLLAFVGPSAGACCYEVGEDVAVQFEGQFVARSRAGTPHVDLKGVARSTLQQAGVSDEAIEVSPLCTICRPDLLHSYRRDGSRSGRMMGIIGFVR